MKKRVLIAALFTGLLFLGADTLRADDLQNNVKLDQVLQKQDEILKTLAEIKDELQVVKIRASNN